MKKTLGLLLIVLALGGAAPAVAQQKDVTGCQDSPLFTRMPGYWIQGCKEVQFDAYAFTVGPNKKTESVEGHIWKSTYYPQANMKPVPSELQIMRNHENALKQQGGTVVYGEKSKATYRLTKGGKEIWVEIRTDFTGKYWLTILEKAEMAQDVVANAEALAQGLKTEGHMVVKGILFDTGKATIKPESAQAIGEVAKLLQADPNLKVFVVGHTDTVGSVESNLKLSQDRAEAVLQSLVRDHGIAAARLRSFGCGPFAPVASNDSEDGKARNRRVELVKQ